MQRVHDDNNKKKETFEIVFFFSYRKRNIIILFYFEIPAQKEVAHIFVEFQWPLNHIPKFFFSDGTLRYRVEAKEEGQARPQPQQRILS
jgi:hypothetical protein